MNRICVIGVYFGKLPQYFPLWLKSCEHNSSIDFLVFTDQLLNNLPENVRVYPMNLLEMKQRAETVLGFSVRLEKPYKCCDYKVIYGLIFRDYVSDYQYWGHCDFDLMFGDLQSFFDAYDLSAYDRFLPLGHLSLYKNSEDVNYRFQSKGSIADYRVVYTSDDGFAFDEMPGLTKIYLENALPMFTQRIFADLASVYHRYRVIEEYTLDAKAKNYPHQLFFWENGKTFRAYYQDGEVHQEEYIYIHFKKRPDFPVNFDIQNKNAFYITNQGFFPKMGDVTLHDMKKYNPYPGWHYEIWERMLYMVKSYWNRAVRRIRRAF